MASIYFHIPFCKRLCGYCDFYRSVKLKYMPEVVAAMHQELAREENFLHDRVVRTIYFGGGTPSLLAPCEIERFVEQVRQQFDCSQLEEITIEVNPEGEVVSTRINLRTKTTNPHLRKAAEDAAKRARFNKVDGVNNVQGTITYFFKLR